MAITLNGSAGVTTNSGAVYDGISRGTAVASTSGTTIDFTSIPSWVKRITVMFSGVSTSGTSNILIQLGTSAGITSSGYTGAGSVTSTASNITSYTTGFGIRCHDQASFITSGGLTITNITSNTWSAFGSFANPTTATVTGVTAGTVSLAATLDRVRITTVNGTDTFDAGTINILYE
jgi:hypothetical protein